MQIAVLGPLAVRHHGGSIVPTAGKPRQVLALLSLHAGRTVPKELLMEEIWGAAPPRSAATTLQTYILQLRRHIAAVLPGDTGLSAKDVLSTSFGGYRLAVEPASHDLNAFRDLATRGGTAMEAGDPRAAARLLREALELWRGPALADTPHGPALQLEAIGMEEDRMQVLEQRIRADLALGRYSGLIAELRILTARHALNENLSAHLMTALYHSGSPWRALEEFRRLRETLSRELGVEPTPRLQRLHQAVLSGDMSLAERPDATAARPLSAG
ncbi:AfsR/SARP family transcriptional regulator [Streptomyces olivoreticuli]|uniref:AfsR/SARP family transcriptional regulator n=1 Tax=Streptomyces olivoreticuli TaxID=68246 RepID=UPI00265AD88E|nr:AfsR/SARP family transcriptional regulator [Streptomyces olivoreticuli]WKK21825.1 AfsR/SARP family transcriptional regulator [Streptomyces olivoreticuli]